MKIVYIKLSEEEYKELEERARKEGFVLLSDYIKSLLFSSPSISSSTVNSNEIVSQIASKLERKVQDLINPFTSQIEDLKKKVAEVVERLDDLEAKIETTSGSKEEKVSNVQQKKQKEGEKKTAIDILNEQGVLFESELKLKNADAFFSKLDREGARIIYTEKERIALSQSFFEEFLNKLKEIKTSDPTEAENELNSKEAKLFRKLVSEGLIIFDGETKSWKPLF